MSEKQEYKIENKILQITEDKLRLTLKEQREIKASGSKFLTYISFIFAFAIPLFTSTFNDVGPISAELLKAIFIVLTGLFSILSIVESIKLIRVKIKGTGDDDWFILRVQGKEKKKKEKNSGFWTAIVDFFYFTDWLDVLRKMGLVFLYLLPIGLWVLVISLIGWPVAWNTAIPQNGDFPVWVATLFFSLLWFFCTYFYLIFYREQILEFFEGGW